MEQLNTGEEYCNFVTERFHGQLISLGITPSAHVISDLACIFQRAEVRIRRLKEKKPTSKKVSLKATQMHEGFLKNLEKNGGLLETSIELFRKEANNLFGCLISGRTESLEAFLFPKQIYIKHCTAMSIKREFTKNLFAFSEKHTENPPKLRHDRDDSIDGGPFHDFYKLFEKTMIDLCELNPNKITFTEKACDRTTYRFLYNELLAYKHEYKKQAPAMSRARTPTNSSYLNACPLFASAKPVAVAVKRVSNTT